MRTLYRGLCWLYSMVFTLAKPALSDKYLLKSSDLEPRGMNTSRSAQLQVTLLKYWSEGSTYKRVTSSHLRPEPLRVIDLASQSFVNIPLSCSKVFVQPRQLFTRLSQCDDLADGQTIAKFVENRVTVLAIKGTQES